LEESEKAEAERKMAEARTKAGEKAKKHEGASSSKDINLAELMRRREEQVEIQNAGTADAKKREELLEQGRVAAEKIQLKEQQKNREEKKRRVKEEWRKQVKLIEQEKKGEDKIQFKKCLAKTLVLEAEKCGIAVTKKVVRKKMTSAELDQEFRELNAAQTKANTRAVVDQIVGEKGIEGKKTEKSGTPGLRMMKAEEETGEGSCLPPVSEIVGAKTRGAGAVENVQSKTEKKGKKILSIPTPVIKEMELKSEGEEADFEGKQRDEVRVEIPQDKLKMVARSVLGDQEEKGDRWDQEDQDRCEHCPRHSCRVWCPTGWTSSWVRNMKKRYTRL